MKNRTNVTIKIFLVFSTSQSFKSKFDEKAITDFLFAAWWDSKIAINELSLKGSKVILN